MHIFDSKRDCHVVLVHPHLGIIQTGNEKIAPSEKNIMENPQYIELMTQAKFYSGELNKYTEKERDYLRQWIANKDLQTILNMESLLNNIISVKQDQRNKYDSSIIKKIFNEALQKIQMPLQKSRENVASLSDAVVPDFT